MFRVATILIQIVATIRGNKTIKSEYDIDILRSFLLND